MTRLNKERLAEKLVDRFGLPLMIELGRTPEGPHVDLRPSDLHWNEGFAVRTTLGWRHVVAELKLGSFARAVLEHMAASSVEQRRIFGALVGSAAAQGGRLIFLINGSPVELAACQSWPLVWQTVRLALERTPLMLDHENREQLEDAVVLWGGLVLAMTIALLPTEEVAVTQIHEVQGLPEGAKQTVIVNRYERNAINRLLCLAALGTKCVACGLDFGEAYGDLGRGFIHVHHVVPVSKLGENYLIDPVRDLVPVCPNCHAMLHKVDPPLTVDELRTRIRTS